MRAGLFLWAMLLTACAKEGIVAPEPARLKVVATPNDASVYVDGHYFGRATVLAEQPKALAPGLHLMTVQAAGHFPHDLELGLPPGITTIDIELRPVPP